MLLREACQGSEFAGAGISDQNIDLPLRLHGLVEAIEVLQSGDISPYSCHVAADRLDGLVEFLLAATRYEDVGALIHEPLRRGEAYSRGASGHHGNLSLQLAHLSSLHFAAKAHHRSGCGRGRHFPRLSEVSDLAPFPGRSFGTGRPSCLVPHPHGLGAWFSIHAPIAAAASL